MYKVAMLVLSIIFNLQASESQESPLQKLQKLTEIFKRNHQYIASDLTNIRFRPLIRTNPDGKRILTDLKIANNPQAILESIQADEWQIKKLCKQCKRDFFNDQLKQFDDQYLKYKKMLVRQKKRAEKFIEYFANKEFNEDTLAQELHRFNFSILYDTQNDIIKIDSVSSSIEETHLD